MKDLLGYDKIQVTLDRIRQFEPPEGYYLAFSGGKDSIVLEYLANLAGVKYDTHFSMTTVDPPELLKFIAGNYNGVHWERPKKSMWQLILDNHMPPTRLMRFCCRELKECGGMNRLVLTGIRSSESHQRKQRQMVELCRSDPRKRYLHPMIDWTDGEVWEFIRDYQLPYCSLYKDSAHPNLDHWELPEPNGAFKRIGCVMCPMGYKKQREFEAERFPNFYNAYMRTFEKLVATGKTRWESADEVMKWWGSSISQERYNDKGMFT